MTGLPLQQEGSDSFEDYLDDYSLLVTRRRLEEVSDLICSSLELNYNKLVRLRVVADCGHTLIVESELMETEA